MAGITDQPFRHMVKKFGVSFMFSELVSAEGLIRNSAKTKAICSFSPKERPMGIQIFGSRPEAMSEAAKEVESFSPELIDLNFGCPAKKVVNGGAGAAVLKNLKLLRTIVQSVVKSVDTPVSCKIRSGWDNRSIVAQEAARIIEGEGACIITVHPRTRMQKFSGSADWNIIRQVKEAVKIPVIGNGDIYSPRDAKYMLNTTGCDAVMIGRAAMGRPWIFSQIDHFIRTSEYLPDPTFEDRVRICIQHYHLALKKLGVSRGLKEMRKHIGWYLKGMPNVSKIRSQLMTMEDPDDVIRQLKDYARSFSQE